MTGQAGFLARLIAALDSEGIPYMVTGSLGSVAHGEPRGTRDVDVVIDPAPQALELFVTAVSSWAYVSREAAREALRERSMFNVIDLGSGWKGDLVVKKTRPFSAEEFRRRRLARVLSLDAMVVSPEDSILSKLEWAKESGSERQLRDVVGVLSVQRDALDVDYLRRWATELGVREALEALLGGTPP